MEFLGLFLFQLAIVLLILIEWINFFVVLFDKNTSIKGYWRSAAIDIDKFGNRHFRALFNKTLIKSNGYKFGNIEETISAVLGHNIKLKKLTLVGKILVFILTEKHCLNSIE